MSDSNSVRDGREFGSASERGSGHRAGRGFSELSSIHSCSTPASSAVSTVAPGARAGTRLCSTA